VESFNHYHKSVQYKKQLGVCGFFQFSFVKIDDEKTEKMFPFRRRKYKKHQFHFQIFLFCLFFPFFLTLLEVM